MILPGLEGQAELGESAKPSRKVGSRTRCGGTAREANLPTPSASQTRPGACHGSGRRRGDLGFQHVAHTGTQPQVGIADDALGDAAGP